MAIKTPTKDPSPSPAYIEAVSEIMQIYKSLPPRPSFEDIEAAKSVIETSTTEQTQLLQQISSQNCPEVLLLLWLPVSLFQVCTTPFSSFLFSLFYLKNGFLGF